MSDNNINIVYVITTVTFLSSKDLDQKTKQDRDSKRLCLRKPLPSVSLPLYFLAA